jgi:hypothetical protein
VFLTFKTGNLLKGRDFTETVGLYCREFLFTYSRKLDKAGHDIYFKFRVLLKLFIIRYLPVLRIRDPVLFWPRDLDPGWEKIQIRDEHSGSYF